MSSFIRLFPLLALILFCCSACQIQPLEISDIQSVQLAGTSGNVANMQGLVRVKNPNSLSFRVKATDLDIFINENKVGKARLTENIKIPANSDKTYILKVEANLVQILFNGLLGMVSSKNSGKVKVRIKGEVKASTLLIFQKKYPIDVERNVDLGK